MKKIKNYIVCALVLCLTVNMVAFAIAEDGYGIKVFEEDFEANQAWTYFEWTATAQAAPSPIENSEYGTSLKINWNYTTDKMIATKPAEFTDSEQATNQKVRICYDILLTENVRAWLNFWSFNSGNSPVLGTSAYFNDNGQFCLPGGIVATNETNYNKYKNYELNKWYNICVYYDFANHTYSLYIDGDDILIDGELSVELRYFRSFRIDIPANQGTLNAAVYMDNFSCYVFGEAPITPPPGSSDDPSQSEEIYALNQLVIEDNFDDLSVGSFTGNKWEYKQHNSISYNVVSEEGKGNSLQTNIPANEASDNMFATMGDLVKKSTYKDSQYWLAKYDIKLSAKGRVYLSLVTNKDDNTAAVPALAYFNEQGVFSLCSSTPTNTENYNKYKNYEIDKWYSVKLYINLEKDTFSLWINNDEITRATPLPGSYKSLAKVRIDMSQAQGTPSQNGNTKVLFDNFELYCPAAFTALRSDVTDGRGDVLPCQTVKIAFSNSIGNIETSDIELKDKYGNTISGYDVSADSNDLIVDFSSHPLEFNTSYTLSIKSSLKDVFGQELDKDVAISFTTAKNNVYASTPVFLDNELNPIVTLPQSGNVTVTADVINPLSEAIAATLVVNLYDSEGEIVDSLTAQKSVAANGNEEISYTVGSEVYQGHTLKAFVISGTQAASPNLAILSASEVTKANITGKDISIIPETFSVHNTQIRAEGTITPKETQPILLTVYPILSTGSDDVLPSLGALQYAEMIYPDADGKFDFTVDLSSVTTNEKYFATLSSRQAVSVSEEMVYLSMATREALRTAVNNADSMGEVKQVLESYIYQGLVEIDASLLTDNAYQTVYEQRTYNEVGDVFTMIENAARLTDEYNRTDWSSLGEFFNTNKNVVLFGCTNVLNRYSKLSANNKNLVHQRMVEKGKVQDFAAIRAYFNEIVTSVSSTVNSTGGSPGGGSGGGGTDLFYSSSGSANSSDESHLNDYVDLADALWAKEDIKALSSAGIISGDGNGYFRPLDHITREEYIKLLVLTLGIDVEAGSCDFPDVSPDSWAAPYIASAARIGLVQGDDKGNFGLGQNITRQDMAVMAYRALIKSGQSLANTAAKITFFDEANISEYAKEPVTKMQQLGIISGMDTGCFLPKEGGTRAQAAKIIYRIFKMLGRDA